MSVEERIVDILSKHPEGLTITNISKELNIHRNTTSKYIFALAKAGIIEQRRIGKVALCSLKKQKKVFFLGKKSIAKLSLAILALMIILIFLFHYTIPIKGSVDKIFNFTELNGYRLEIELEKQKFFTNELIKISGFFGLTDKTSIENQSLSLTLISSDSLTNQIVSTDLNGTFSLSFNLNQGNYTLIASSGELEASLNFEVLEIPFTITLEKSVFKPNETVSIFIQGKANKEFTLEIFGQEITENFTLTTDEKGFYIFNKTFPPGSYSVRILSNEVSFEVLEEKEEIKLELISKEFYYLDENITLIVSGTPDQKFDLSVLKENLTVFSFLGQTNSSGLEEISFKLFEKGNYSAILKYGEKEELTIFEVLERIENITEEILTQNISLNVVSIEQGKAEINKPVKWKKVLRAINPTEKEVEVDFDLELPENSFNITLEEKENKTKLEGKRLKDKLKPKESKEYVLIYYTEAPHAYEEVLNKYRKIIRVNSSLHYENILAYTEIEKSPRNSVKLYWLVNSEKIDVTFNESFKVKLLDLDNDELIEKVEWLIPSLSEQVFEINIIILNPYTYLRDGETWIVAFNTTGKADLVISSPNANWKEMLTDNLETFDEMEFLDLKCGENSLKSSLKLIDGLNNTYDYSQLTEEDSVKVKKFLVKDYSCEETGYFINKMFRAGYAILEFNFSGQLAYAYDPTTVGTSTTNTATARPHQRKSFYGLGRFWVFYFNGSAIVYKTSTDGITWSSENYVTTPNDLNGYAFSLYFNGTHVDYVANSGGSTLRYRRGRIESDGTITWVASEQSISISGSSADVGYTPTIAVDSSGYAYIAYTANETSTSLQRKPKVIKNQFNNGSWSTASGYPLTLNDTGHSNWRVNIIPLTNNRMLAVYAYSGEPIRVRRFNGSSWEAEVRGTLNVADGYTVSAAPDGDDAHIVFLQHTEYDIEYVKYTYSSNSLGGGVELEGSQQSTTSYPVISIDNNLGHLYVFWANNSQIFYRKYNGTAWEPKVTWITETALTGNNLITSFLQRYGNYIGLVYMNGTTSPYQVRFEFLNISCDIIISSCQELNQPNTYYCLNQNVSSSATCFNATANNITLDCQGYWINYSQSSTGYAINITGYNNIVIKSCNIVQGSSTPSSSHAIYGSRMNNSLIFNNSIITSGSSSDGISLNFGFDNNISLNTISTSGSNCGGMYINSSSNNIITSNIITTSGAPSYGVYLDSSTNATLTFNKLNTSKANSLIVEGTIVNHFNHSIDQTNLAEGLPIYYCFNCNNAKMENQDYSNTYGQIIFAWSKNVTINNITMSNDGFNFFNVSYSKIENSSVATSRGRGIFLYSNSILNNVTNNTISTTNSYGYGIYLYSSSRNILASNTISTTNSYSHGIYLYSSSNYNTITSNVVTTSHSTSSHGIYLYSSSRNNITGGSYLALGRGSSYDFYLRGASSTNNFTNTNFTAPRRIYFYDNTSWFNYNNRTDIELWLKTRISSAAAINRSLIKWTQQEIKWNENASTTITAYYEINGLYPNQEYK
ncbi:MAG: right-handed parallel beta-helix repeat-containing protein, partial [Candidatus Aenigmatarchaeota archaeon]